MNTEHITKKGEVTRFKRIVLIIALLAVSFSLFGCQTVKDVGEAGEEALE